MKNTLNDMCSTEKKSYMKLEYLMKMIEKIMNLVN